MAEYGGPSSTGGRLRGGTLFSGIGAPELAMPWVDWRWCAEIDPFASAVLAHHHPHSQNLGDVNEIDADAVEPVDLVVFGSPCQSWSVAGKRRGLDDPRGNLALVALRLVSRIRPRWVVFENVPGLLSSDGGRDFGAFLRLLGECGYGFSYRILDAQHAGVPQRRRRVFVVGYLGDWRPPAAVLFEPESLRGDHPPRRAAGQNAPTLPSRSTAGGGLGTDFDCDGGLIAFDARQSDVCVCGDRAAPLDMDGYTQAVRFYSKAGTHGGGEYEDAAPALKSTGNPAAVAFNNTGQGWWNDAEVATGLRDMSAGSGSKEATLVATAPRARDGARGVDSDCTDTLVAYGGGNQSGPIDLATACNANERWDFESETFVAHSLRGEGFDASEDGTGRGTPLVPVLTLAIRGRGDGHDLEWRDDGTANAILTPCGGRGGIGVGAVAIPQNLEIQDGNRHNSSYASSQETDAGTLLRTVRRQIGTEAFAEWGLGVLNSFPETEVLLAGVFRHVDTQGTLSGKLDFSARDGAVEDTAGAMREMRSAGCARCTPPGWRSLEQRRDELGAYLSLLPQSGTPPPWLLRNLREVAQGTRLLQQALDTLEEARRSAGIQDTATEDVLGLREPREREGALRDALHAGEAGATAPLDRRSGVMSVRRLTPRQRECCRLQGFPDSHLDITYRGKPAADGNKYRALGNSMCVPVITWLGKRIQLVEDTIRSPARGRAA